MKSQTDQITPEQPQEFFDDASFKTLYGGVVVTWVATSAIADVWDSLDPKMLGFIVAIIVAFVGYLMKEKRTLKKLLITPFNGLLIYLTIMGGTSFLPAPTPAETTDNSEPSVTEAAERGTHGEAESVKPASTFFTSWNYNQNLIKETTLLKRENQELQEKNSQLQEVNTNIKVQLDQTQEAIQKYDIPSGVKDQLLKNIQLDAQFNPTNSNQ